MTETEERLRKMIDANGGYLVIGSHRELALGKPIAPVVMNGEKVSHPFVPVAVSSLEEIARQKENLRGTAVGFAAQAGIALILGFRHFYRVTTD